MATLHGDRKKKEPEEEKIPDEIEEPMEDDYEIKTPGRYYTLLKCVVIPTGEEM